MGVGVEVGVGVRVGVGYMMYYVGSNGDLYSTSVTAGMYTTSCYIEPRCNGIRLLIVLSISIIVSLYWMSCNLENVIAEPDCPQYMLQTGTDNMTAILLSVCSLRVNSNNVWHIYIYVYITAGQSKENEITPATIGWQIRWWMTESK